MKSKERKQYSQSEALEKLRSYCGYQERSKRQLIQKMRLMFLPSDWHEELLSKLVEEGFLNETRFATQFARGKSKGRGWGPVKIKQRLNAELGKGDDIQAGLDHIDLESAGSKLTKALIRKKEELMKKADPNIKQKLLRFCLSRGFEMDFSIQLLKMELRL